jgi:hypothetical protein
VKGSAIDEDRVAYSVSMALKFVGRPDHLYRARPERPAEAEKLAVTGEPEVPGSMLREPERI